MDDWMRVPGASVEGHWAEIRTAGHGAEPSCSCGRPFAVQPSAHSACLALVLHLQAAVRDGARVTVGGRGDGAGDGGLAGVREPRGPVPSRGSGSAALDVPSSG